jgi:ribosomal protein S18 acetylase RimI-like enzyme
MTGTDVRRDARYLRLLGSGCRVARADGDMLRLRDGSCAVMRPLRSTDGPLLIDGFARLSPRSRRMRFLMGKNALSAKEVQYLTDIDHHNHEALAALDVVTGRGLGVARYIRSADDPLSAEVAITIVDEWQGRGLGTELIRHLARRAQAEGIKIFRALVAADNAAVLALLRRMDGVVELIEFDSDTAQYQISLRARQLC